MTDRPYITEAGPEVFDELYNLISRQVSYLTKTPTHYSIIPIKTLVNHSFDVLIGVPTTTFLNNMVRDEDRHRLLCPFSINTK